MSDILIFLFLAAFLALVLRLYIRIGAKFTWGEYMIIKYEGEFLHGFFRITVKKEK